MEEKDFSRWWHVWGYEERSKGQRRLQLFELQFNIIFFLLKAKGAYINLAKYWHLWNLSTHLFGLLISMLFFISHYGGIRFLWELEPDLQAWSQWCMKGSDGRWKDIKISYANFVLMYNNHAEKCGYQSSII